MLVLDVRTLFVVSTIISLYMSLVLFLYSRSQKTYPGFGFWLAGNILALITYFSYATRGYIPDFLSIPVANSAGVLGNVFRLEGMKKFFNGPGLWLPNFLAPAVVFVAHTYFLYIDDNLVARDVVFTCANLLYVSRMIWLLIFDSKEDTKPIALFFASLLIIFMIGLGSRMVNWILWSDNRGLLLNTELNSVSTTFLLIFDISWAVCLILLNSQRMNSEVFKLTGQLERLASTDPLTGVYNRRKFLEIGRAELERARRYGRSLSLLMFDLDNFKDVNDTYGHAAGDEMLKKVVEVCKKALRQGDAFGRFGGDEFVILFPETDLNEALEIARRLNHEIRAIAHDWNWIVHVSMSYGIAQAAAQDASLDELIQRADILLYSMKAAQRNASPIAPA